MPNRTYAKGIMGHGIWTNGQSIVKDGVVIGGEIHDSPSPLIPAESCILPDPNTSCDVHTTVLEKLPAPEIPVGMELVPIRMDVPILAPGYAFLKADGKEINGFSVAATGPGPTAMLMVKDEQAAMLRQAKSLVIRVRK